MRVAVEKQDRFYAERPLSARKRGGERDGQSANERERENESEKERERESEGE